MNTKMLRPFTSTCYGQTDKPPKRGENSWNQKRRIHVRMLDTAKHILKTILKTICCGIAPIARVHHFYGRLSVRRTT